MNLSLELKHTLRLIKKNKYFTSLCVLVICLGIAQSLIIFQVINNQLLRTLPFPDGDKFVVFSLRNETARESYTNQWDAYRYRYIKENSDKYELLGAMQVATLATASDGENTETFTASRITPNLLDVTGEKPAMGRSLLDSDDEIGAEPVVLISHRMWVNYYASDENIVNTRSRINGKLHTIVGVMPEGYRYPVSSDLWLPLQLPGNLQPGEAGPKLTVVGIMKNGVERERAGREITGLMEQLSTQFSHEYKDSQTKVLPFTRQFFDDEGVVTLSKLILAILIFIVGLASINVGNLLLVRANERSHELGVRGALGATRWGLIRHILMESSFICFLGGVLGILLSVVALWGTTGTPAGPDFMGMPFWISYDLELSVVLLALLLIAIIWLLAGGIPAYRASRINIYETLSSGTKHAGSKSTSWFIMTLVGFELVVSVFILITNGVTITSLNNEFAVDYGIDSDNYLTASVSLPAVNYQRSTQIKTYMDDLQYQLQSNGSAKKVAFSTALPSQNMPLVSYNLEDRDVRTENHYPEKPTLSVSDDYFDAVGVKLVSGRFFNNADNADSLPVVVIDKFLAENLWPSEDSVLGKRIQINPGSNGQWLTIVGIAEHPISGNLEEVSDPRKALYRPISQAIKANGTDNTDTRLYVLAEVEGVPEQFQKNLKDASQSADRDVPVFLMKSLTTVLEESVAEFEDLSIMLTTIGIIALVLASSGIYAIMSRSVMMRTREISIKRALGLTNNAAVFSFVRRSAWLVLIAFILGGAISLLAINVLLSTTEIASLPWVVAVVTLAIAVIMFSATYFPAKKIVANEPGETLQQD